jgi:hypothetical protein
MSKTEAAMSVEPNITGTDIWERIIQPEKAGLSAEEANYFLGLSFTDNDLRRMHDLVQRQQNHDLSVDEQEELAAYRQVGLQLDLLRSKARRSMGVRPQPTELH